MSNFYSQRRRILPIYNYSFYETQATENSFEMLPSVQSQVEQTSKEFNKLYASQPSFSEALIWMSKLPEMSMKNLKQNQSEQFEKKVPMLIAIKKNITTQFQQHTCKNVSITEIITSEFFKTHCKLKSQNNQLKMVLSQIPQPTFPQFKGWNAELTINRSRQNYRSLEIIKKVWTKYYYHYLNGNRIYINSAMSLNSLLQQYWIKQLNMQKFMAYVPQKQFYKTINLQNERNNIKLIVKCFNKSTIQKETLSKAIKKIKNLLLQDISKIETHDKYQNQLVKLKTIQNNALKHFTQFVTQYAKKCEILIKNFDRHYDVLLKFYEQLNQSIKQMEDSHQQQKNIKNYVRIFIKTDLNYYFAKIRAILSVLNQTQNQLITQAKQIQIFHKKLNKIFQNDYKHKYYVSDLQKQIIEKDFLDFQKQEFSFVQNEYIEAHQVQVRDPPSHQLE